jgi:hypothetical protein
MAFRHGKNTKVLYGEHDLSSFFNEASASRTVETGETTTFGKSAKTYIVGLSDGTASLSGMFDGDPNASDEVLAGSLGVDGGYPVTVAVASLALGSPVQVLSAKTTSYEVSSPVSDVVAVSAEVQADGGIDAGISLHDLTAETATGNGSSHDGAASSANGGVAQVHVTANTVGGNTTIKIQHSANNSVWVDLVTFTVVSSGSTTAERVEVAAGTTVNRYLRVQHTLAAAGSVTYQASFSRR